MEYASVDRSTEEAQAWYDRIAGWYDRLIYPFERSAIDQCLDVAAVEPDEAVLEIGSGTGHTLVQIAEDTGENGRAVGVDISTKMVETTHEKLLDGDYPQASIQQADATSLPFDDDVFDAVVMTFTLELFSEDDLLTVLDETDRVLKEDGRLVVLSLYREGRMARIYERLHEQFPRQLDCRPLPLDDLLEARDWIVRETAYGTLGGIPYIVVDARLD